MGSLILNDLLIPSFSQIASVCETYGIGNLIRIARKIEGTANMNIEILTQTGRYVVKIFSCNPERFNFVIRMLNTLKKNKVPVLIPLKNKEGKHYIQIGDKLIQVTRFVSGYPFQHLLKQAASSGRMLRRFHDVLAGIFETIEPVASLYPSNDTLLSGIEYLRKTNDTIHDSQTDAIIYMYDEIVSKWESSKNKLPETIIHGDWNLCNQNFTTAGEIRCIIDFDFMSRAERIFDIAYFLWCLEISEEYIVAAKAFMEGYGRLSEEEIQYLPFEIARIRYYYACTSAASLCISKELPEHMQKHYPFIKWVVSEDGQSTVRSLCLH